MDTAITRFADLGVWLGIAFCITQSAIFSGLNLSVFNSSRLRLEAHPVSGGSSDRVENVILVWGDEPTVITGDDVLGLLMEGTRSTPDTAIESG